MPSPLKRGEVRCIKSLATPGMLAKGWKCPCEECSPELYEGESGVGSGESLKGKEPDSRLPIPDSRPAIDGKSAAAGEVENGD